VKYKITALIDNTTLVKYKISTLIEKTTPVKYKITSLIDKTTLVKCFVYEGCNFIFHPRQENKFVRKYEKGATDNS
jgi:hypothetical protein